MCAFYNNNSTEKGGSIFIKESNCVLVHICFSNSSSNEDGCAYYIKNSIFDPEKSYAIECSVSKCSGKQSAFVYWEGDIQISNMNTSYNIITTNAAYSISSITNTIILNFTTVSNCSSSEIGVVNVGPMTRNVTNCNYLNNEFSEGESVDSASSSSVILCSNSCTFSNCSFVRNKGNYLFYDKPTLLNCFFHENTLIRTVQRDDIFNTFGVESIEPLDSFISHYAVEGCPGAYYHNKDISDKKMKREKIKMRNKIAINVYRTSISEVLNLSSIL